MSKSVSNDALWEKLSEIEERINKCLKEENKPVSAQQKVDITSELKAIKEEVVENLKKYIQGLGAHCDKHFKFIQTKVGKLGNDMSGAIACLLHIIKELEKQQKPKDTQFYFNFKLFKVKKTSLMITIFGLLVFILTLFCMKQQNDYSLLMDEYYRQSITVQKLYEEFEVNKEKQLNNQNKK